MSTNSEGSHADAEALPLPRPCDPEPFPTDGRGLVSTADADGASSSLTESVVTLSSLPPGARLVLRCRKDWRAASIAAIEPDCVRLNVASPSGHTYRVRRPHDSPLTYEGPIPILSDRDPANWRVTLIRYDVRW